MFMARVRVSACVVSFAASSVLLLFASTDATAAIHAYADATSYCPGDTLRLYVSAPDSTVPVWIGRQSQEDEGLWSGVIHDVGVQAVPDSAFAFGCAWNESFRFVIPVEWTTGLYYVRLHSGSTGEWEHYPFTLRPGATQPRARIVYVRPVSTFQAYNDFGGRSYYSPSYAERANRLSFERPYANHGWGGAWRSSEAELIRFFQPYGLDVYDSRDIHRDPSILDAYDVLVISEHDEYVSRPVYDAYLAFRERGGDLFFMSANNCYYQVRYEDAGNVQVCYKNSGLDPIVNTNPELATGHWRETPLDRPEEALVGVAYDGWMLDADGNGASIPAAVADPMHWSFVGTGVTSGQVFGVAGCHEFVGGEWDRVKEYSPPGIEMLLETVIPEQWQGAPTYSVGLHHATYYEHCDAYGFAGGRGARVFASGSNTFACTLQQDPQVHRWMTNLLHAALDSIDTDVAIDVGRQGGSTAPGVVLDQQWYGSGYGADGGAIVLADADPEDAEMGPPEAYSLGRTGDFSYFVDLPAAYYDVRIGVVARQAGSLGLTIDVEGAPYPTLPEWIDAGSVDRGEVLRSVVRVEDGTLDLHFSSADSAVALCYLRVRQVWPDRKAPDGVGAPGVVDGPSGVVIDLPIADEEDVAGATVSWLDPAGAVLASTTSDWYRARIVVPDSLIPAGAADFVLVRRDLFGNLSSPSPATPLPGPATAVTGPSPLSLDAARITGVVHAPGAGIRFQLKGVMGAGSLAIYDLRGRRVRHYGWPAGDVPVRSVTWDRRDEKGWTVSRGVYVARLTAGGAHDVRRVTVSW